VHEEDAVPGEGPADEGSEIHPFADDPIGAESSRCHMQGGD
jgi:hypothetical protein